MITAGLIPWSCLACTAFTRVTLPVIARDDSAAGNGNARSVYESKVLVSNGGIPANFTDENLINGWGVAFNPTGFVWVSSEDAGKSVLYDGNGQRHSRRWTIRSRGRPIPDSL